MRPRSNGRTLVAGGFAAVFGSVFIVVVGIMLAHLCFFLLQPECVTMRQIPNTATATASMNVSDIFTDSHHPKTLGTATKPDFPAATNSYSTGKMLEKLATPEPAGNTSAKVKHESVAESEKPAFDFPSAAKFPPQCTPAQLGVLGQQLDGEGCTKHAKKPWNSDRCSFASKTKCGNANPHWFYDFIHQSSKDESFRGIIVGCNKGYEAVELLRIASPPTDKYDVEKWSIEFSKVDGKGELDLSVDCPIYGMASSNNRGTKKKIHVFCIEGMPKTADQLEKTKKALGYGDELDITPLVVGDTANEDGVLVKNDDPIGAMKVGIVHWNKGCKQNPEVCEIVPSSPIDDFIESKPLLKATGYNTKTGQYRWPPIHIMSITAEGSDYEILKGAVQNLSRIQYIDFWYHWNWRWGKQELKDLIFRLKKKGFVCYFTGTDGQDLWRITDCWQAHYELKYAANIGCVNANIPASIPLLDKMEGIFLKTLEKTS